MLLDAPINSKWLSYLKGNFVDDWSITFTDDASMVFSFLVFLIILLQNYESAYIVIIHNSNSETKSPGLKKQMT